MLSVCFTTCLALSPYRHEMRTVGGENGESDGAAFVTDLLPQDFEKAQTMSKMTIDGWDHDMWGGFFTIDSKTNSNTYFAFSKSLDGNEDAPILLWLQGGPGASSMFGLFTEIGPFNIDANMSVAPRQYSWNKNYHLLFIDNPLGTGFSFTDASSAMATNQSTVGEDLYLALSQFFQLFPNLRKNDFYVTGESYAGKYVPACGHAIHMHNQKSAASGQINLKGIAIGDGAFDPPGQFYNFGELLWYLGMVDQSERDHFKAYEVAWKAKLDAADLVGAFEIFDEMLNGDYYGAGTYYANVTGMGSNYFNFEQGPGGSSLTKNYFIDWLGTAAGRNAMNVGQQPYAVLNQTVEDHLREDWMRGVLPYLTTLLEHPQLYKVHIYSGQNDIILGAPLTEQSLRNLEWSGRQAFLKAKKKVWTVPSGAVPATGAMEGDDADLAGYARQVGNFTYVVVRGAGHMVPGDQPTRALDMISRFVIGTPY